MNQTLLPLLAIALQSLSAETRPREGGQGTGRQSVTFNIKAGMACPGVDSGTEPQGDGAGRKKWV